MAIEVHQNEKISGGGKNGMKKRSQFCHPSEKSKWGERKHLEKREEELLSERLTPT